MENFVRRKNIEHYQRLLSQPTDEAQRHQLAKSLEEEEAKGIDEPSRHRELRPSQLLLPVVCFRQCRQHPVKELVEFVC